MSHQPDHISRRRLANDAGFSMFAIVMIMMACGMFVIAGYAAANGDLPLSGRVADRKTTFAAAEAGVNFYQFHLNQDNDYWLKCTNVARPNATENSPVNQEWNGVGADPRTWRTIPGSAAQYTIELLPNPSDPRKTCVQNDGKSMLDPVSNVFRIRVTGRPTATSRVRRSIIATFRRTGFLDFLYYTNYEDLDPSAYGNSADVATANSICANRPRASRSSWCAEISFGDRDAINGPLHSNDTLQMCGGPTFGRDPKDRVTVYGPAPGWITAPNCAGTAPNFKSPLRVVTKSVDMPSSNDELKNIVLPAYHYRGRTTILFQTSTPGKMQVTNSHINSGTPTLVDVPSNGVVYVDSDGSCTQQPPTAQTYTYNTYTESTACGNLYVSGSYSNSMTLAADNDIIIKPYNANCTGGTCNGDLVKANPDAVMGLIANQFVRVYHPCSGGTNQRGYMQTVKIEAAILSLKHSFIADNHACGSPMGNLTVVGAIAQKYRGTVGTGTRTAYTSGYVKDYWYDDRLKYRTPPYFLQPTSSAWNVVRFNEQTKAR